MQYSVAAFNWLAESIAPSKAAHTHVAIVGAGPRGTSTLERLCASASEFLVRGARLTVHVVDPYPPGPGAVWRTAQSAELLMNTVASQVTLFTDKSVECSGPVRPGPSLYDWAVNAEPGLGPDDYPSRQQYGRYLQWVFGEIVRRAPPGVEIETHTARAIRLDDASKECQTLILSNGDILSSLAAVILTQGHLPLMADPGQKQLTAHAKQHGLRHIEPSNPADVDLSVISAGEPVILRGLGLNFFDYMALLTIGRGGHFTETPNGLRYYPSGKEPRMYAGSRRGVPFQARGDNAKGPYGRHEPLVITEKVIAEFRKRADAGDAIDFQTEIWPYVAKEVETVYYEALLGHQEAKRLNFQGRFLATPHDSPEESGLLDEFGISQTDRWSWDHISRPYGGRTFNTAVDWRAWMLDHLREDAKQAALGNVDGPLKAALDVMRDLRNELRLIVDHGGLTGDSRRKDLDLWYTPLNAYVSIGPPRQRIEQMVALIEAGILDIIGPHLKVQATEGAWFAESRDIPGSRVRATSLIEARLPNINLRHTSDELLAHLLKTGQCRPHTLTTFETEGLDVTPQPNRVIDSRGRAHPRRFAVGVPTEGVHWVTAAGARPGVNSVLLLDTDAVARATLHVVKTERDFTEQQVMTVKSLLKLWMKVLQADV